MLRGLYDLGIPGKEEEFTAYRILMLIHGRNRSGELLSRLYRIMLLNVVPRFESLCRSTNQQTEIGLRSAARPFGAESSIHGQLPFSL